jgi:hypothetical protein
MGGQLVLFAAMALGFAIIVAAARGALTDERAASPPASVTDGTDGPPSDADEDTPTDAAQSITDADAQSGSQDTVVATDAGDAPGTDVPAAPPAEPVPGTVLVVGGSSLAGLDWNPTTKRALQGAEFTLDLESCRRLYLESCSALRSSAPTTAYEVVRAKGPGHETLILFGGYNDSGGRFKEGLEGVVSEARDPGIPRIIWASYRVDADDEITDLNEALRSNSHRGNNTILDDLLDSGNYDDVVVADWNTYAADQSHWFSDRVHFTALGSWGAADYLSRKLAFLDKRACPQPRRPGEARQKPCPDPDRKPPDVDYPAVYGLKPGRLLCYAVEDPSHIECKPPSKVDDADLDAAVLETLRYGDTGQQVENLQTKLRKLGYYKGSPSARFDDDTAAAVMRYQQRQKLRISGVADGRTRERLGFGCPDLRRGDDGKCPVGADAVVFPWTLREGATGVRVYVVQARLQELDYLSTKPSSQFGNRTIRALKKFQAAEGLAETGEVDAKTARALGFDVP